MTTHTYSSVVDHTSDAGFRAWGSQLSAGLATAGLVQTADTGQINWLTVTRPATNTAGGYEIWRFANSSRYLKIEYGTAASATIPQMWITVGAGSNGSGTLTGQLSTRVIFTSAGALASIVTNYPTYICVLADAFALCWKANSAGGGTCMSGFVVVGNSVDADGVTDSVGFGVLRQAGTAHSFQSVRTAATAATYTASNFFSLVPGSVTSSLDASGNNQAYLVWMNLPTVKPFLYALTYLNSEVAELNTFSLTPFGLTSHTYLALGSVGAGGSANSNDANYQISMIYE